ncbi:MAG TPA: hypothetical protein V6D37_00700 [Candidatus Sericytochromatia bacterium]
MHRQYLVLLAVDFRYSLWGLNPRRIMLFTDNANKFNIWVQANISNLLSSMKKE